MPEVRERDYFFIVSFHLWGFLAGTGPAAAQRRLTGPAAGGRRFAAASPVLALALLPMAFNWAWATRASDHSARDWAYDLLQSVEPYGILSTGGDNDTFPPWYLQEVEGIRQDVTVIVDQYRNTQWCPSQLKRRTGPERQRPLVDDGGLIASPPGERRSRARVISRAASVIAKPGAIAPARGRAPHPRWHPDCRTEGCLDCMLS